MSSQPIGIVAGLQQKRADVIAANPQLAAKILGRSVYVEPKETRILVDCRTGRRTISEVPPRPKQLPAQPQPPMEPPKLLLARDVLEQTRLLVQDIWGVNRAELITRSTKPREGARYAVYLLLRQVYGWSLPKIGSLVGRDHTSVMAGLKRARDLQGKGTSHWAARFDEAARRLIAMKKGVER